MPGAHSYVIHLSLIILHEPWPRIYGLCREKKKESKVKGEPAHGPPLQARVVAANRTVRTTSATILAHMEMNRWGQSKMKGGKNVDEGSRYGMAKAAGKQSLLN